jgi:hypothetical protein
VEKQMDNDDDYSIEAPQVLREQGLILVRFHDDERYLEFGVDSEFMPIDDIEMWTHEFSERTIHYQTNGGNFPISISIFPSQIPFRIHHLMVSLHTPSIIRIEDEDGNTVERRYLTPEEFEKMINWRKPKNQNLM